MNDEERLAHIEKQLKVLPSKPGVYVIFGEDDKVIYVGKAKDLSNRVRTHFAPSTDFSKSRVIREKGVRIEAHQVTTENEAMLLEYNMIQEHQPPLNERWKDGKTYPRLEVTMGEQFPRFVFTRELDNPDSVYLGPYSDLRSAKRSLRYMLKFFPVADCHKEIHLGDADDWAKTCIRRRTKQCMAPCQFKIDENEYNDGVNQIVRFFSGEIPTIVEDVEQKMKESATNQEYEKAAKYRDTLKSIKRTMERQSVFLEDVQDCYVLVEEQNKTELCVTLQKIEDGRIVRRDSNVVTHEELSNGKEDFFISFLVTMLQMNDPNFKPSIPRFVLEGNMPEDVRSSLTDFGFDVVQPTDSIDKQLVDMAKNHAKKHLQRRLLVQKDKRLPTQQVEDLREILGLDIPPFIIDTFDISTLMGTNTVASCVRFQNGKPLKKGYRRFKIQTVDQQDDFASMEEVVFRRYRDVKDGVDPKGLEVPDLIVIDGGQEQLKRAVSSLNDIGLSIPVIGLAKKLEEIYFPDVEEPINENNDRPGMLLIRACRDEAHRFAVSYQRNLRQKEGLKSILDDISGIGPKRRKILLKHYKTVKSIAKESSETLSEKTGISRELASQVIEACRSFTTRESDRFRRRS